MQSSDLFKNYGQSTNPNNITKSGMYYMTSGTTNAPTTSGFLLIHFESDSRIAQLAIINGVSNNYYLRTKPSGSGTTYSDWRRIVTSDDLDGHLYITAGGNVAIEAAASSSNTRFRLQLATNGDVSIFRSTDGGKTWPDSKKIASYN